MNKRITQFNVYVADSDMANPKTRATDYVLVKELKLSGNSFDIDRVTTEEEFRNSFMRYGAFWGIYPDGVMRLANGDKYSITRISGGTIDYDQLSWLKITYDDYKAGDITLSSRLAHTTKNYAKGFDQAMILGGRTFIVNPYFDKRYENMIFTSVIGSSGVGMVDVIPTERYIILDNQDGNDIIGIEKMSNQDLFIGKQSSTQRVDVLSTITADNKAGAGVISRQSIVNLQDRIIFAGTNGIYEYDTSQVRNISELNLGSEYLGWDKAKKRNIKAIRDEQFGSYRMVYDDGVTPKEYIYSRLGWFNFDNSTAPISQYFLAEEGQLRVVDANGIIYEIDPKQQTGTGYEFISIPFDIETLLGEEYSKNTRIIIRGVGIERYSPHTDFEIGFYINGDMTALHTDKIEVTKGTEPDQINYRLPRGGIHCSKFNLSLKGTGADDKIPARIKSLNVYYDIVKVGLYGYN
jgi:hypothetical protein